jgi:hypothetical protein
VSPVTIYSSSNLFLQLMSFEECEEQCLMHTLYKMAAAWRIARISAQHWLHQMSPCCCIRKTAQQLQLLFAVAHVLVTVIHFPCRRPPNLSVSTVHSALSARSATAPHYCYLSPRLCRAGSCGAPHLRTPAGCGALPAVRQLEAHCRCHLSSKTRVNEY